MDPIHWKRVQRALLQYARVHEISTRRVSRVMRVLPQLVAVCGHYTRNRRMAVRVGEVLLSGKRPRVLAPSCPDYTYQDGRYTFRGVGSDVPLLTRKHLRFLRKVHNLLPEVHVTILVADQEAADQAIRQAVGLQEEEFRRRIEASVRRTTQRVHSHGWDAQLMTQYVPGFLEQEAREMRALLADAAMLPRLTSDTVARQALYRRIGTFTHRQMLERTARTAAQYLLLGAFAQQEGMLVCNHTTTSLAWYLRSRVGLLHNPITVY